MVHAISQDIDEDISVFGAKCVRVKDSSQKTLRFVVLLRCFVFLTNSVIAGCDAAFCLLLTLFFFFERLNLLVPQTFQLLAQMLSFLFQCLKGKETLTWDQSTAVVFSIIVMSHKK